MVVGAMGDFGVGGKGGTGGRHGLHLTVNCSWEYWSAVAWVHWQNVGYTISHKEDRGRALNGDRGENNSYGNNDYAIDITPFKKLSSIIELYKDFVSTQYPIGIEPKSRKLTNFLKKIDQNEVIRKKRSITNKSMVEENYLTSSASTKSSIIHNIITWIGKTGNSLVQTLNVGFKSDKVSGLHESTGLAMAGNSFSFGSRNNSAFFTFDFNATLILADLIVKKFSTPIRAPTYADPNLLWLEAQASSLNIVEECENLFIQVHKENNEQFNYDFSFLQKEIFDKILQLDDMNDLGSVRKEALEMINLTFSKKI
jgi:hypothetical protein